LFGALTVRLAVLVTPPYTAEIDTTVEFDTTIVVIWNAAIVLPAGTVTLDGTIATELLLDKDTIIPPLGADTFNVIVPVDGFSPQL